MDGKDFGTVSQFVEDQVPDVEKSFLERQQERLEKMVRDPKWIPLLESMEARIEYYKSMQWIDPTLSNEEIGQNAKVGAIVISELQGILDEVRAIAGDELGRNRSTSSSKKN